MFNELGLPEYEAMEAFVQYQNRIAPHGKEWQNIYRQIMTGCLGVNIFPAELEQAIALSLKKVKAGSCSDPKLYKALAAYDPGPVDGLNWVEELQPGSYFVTKEGSVYQLIEKRRTRYLCEQLGTKKRYLFQGVVRVKTIDRATLRAKGVLLA